MAFLEKGNFIIEMPLGFKSGLASSNVVGKICPLVVIGLTELLNSGWAPHPAQPRSLKRGNAKIPNVEAKQKGVTKFF